MKISIQTTVNATLDDVWRAWTTPADIMIWNAASADWHTPHAEIDLRVGGRFSYRMEARDGSMAFDFTGVFTRIVARELIEYELEDGRMVSVRFLSADEAVTVSEIFEAESANEGEQQRQGWQAILDNFRSHVEARGGLSNRSRGE